MDFNSKNRIIQYAFFTSVATTIYWLESMAVRALPLPFLRIGLANVVIVYLLLKHEFVMALVITAAKTLLGGLLSFTLLSPATVLSISGGIGSLLIMYLLLISPARFSVLGISVAGAVVHNVIQVLCVRWLIIPRDSVLYLMPVLILIGIGTGLATGFIAFELYHKLEGTAACSNQNA